MARIWITGARGFIGRHLAAWLAARGHTISGIGHGSWPESEARAWGVQHWLNGDIHSSNLGKLLQDGGAPDCIFHLAGGSSVGAAIASPHEDFTRTVATTAELLDWIRSETDKVKLVAVSSAAVYGAGHTGPIGEDKTELPFSPYGYNKLLMEQLCRSYVASYGLSISVVRLFSVYGAWLKKQLLWDMCLQLSLGKQALSLGGTGDELRDWTDIRDVVRALELVMNMETFVGAMPVINVGTEIGTSVKRVAERIMECWPSPLEILFSGQSRPGDPFSLIADCGPLRSMGFEWEISLDDGIRAYVNWYLQYSRSHGDSSRFHSV